MLGLAEADVDMIRNFGTAIDDDAVWSLVLSTRLLDSRFRRPGRIRGSRRRSRSGGSSMTSTPGGSAKCSRTGRPSLASKGGAASRVPPPGVVLIGVSALILVL
jgi:hypothetical protein